MLRTSLLLALLLALPACTSLASLAETLNQRQVRSCLWASGAYGPFMSFRLVTATGGQSVHDCLRE